MNRWLNTENVTAQRVPLSLKVHHAFAKTTSASVLRIPGKVDVVDTRCGCFVIVRIANAGRQIAQTFVAREAFARTATTSSYVDAT